MAKEEYGQVDPNLWGVVGVHWMIGGSDLMVIFCDFL